jgi:hypothetical protein
MVVTLVEDQLIWACPHLNCKVTIPFDGIKDDHY